MNETTKHVVVRFAPSPTGYLHIGSIRTALYDYLFAKKTGGTFILRVEDTDRKRFVADGERQLLESLAWAGITYDEGPIHQSDRLPIYKQYAEQLVKSDHAYYCFCSPEVLERVKKEQEQQGFAPRYNRACRRQDASDVTERLQRGESHVIRLKVPETGATEFSDAVRGAITVPNETIEDQVLMKSDGFPTYHLAVVVDDNDMNVTHIFRGDEWIPSTPKHILLYQAFGWKLPTFVHLAVIQRPDKTKKLSKRDGSTSVDMFRNDGYLAEALNNYLALQGWNPGGEQEIMTMSEMIEKFDIEKLQKAGAAYNQDKLDWFNQQYILKLEPERFIRVLSEFIQTSAKVESELPRLRTLNADSKEYARFMKLAFLERMRGVTLYEIAEQAFGLMEVGEYDTKILAWKKSTPEDAKEKLEHVKKFVDSMSEDLFQHEHHESIKRVEEIIKNEISSRGWGTGDALWPLRVSLSGRGQSPSPFELLWALGKAESLKRIDFAIHKLA